ncbi:MAG: c-type cytochrome [Planctomycetota bacterium]
MADRGDTHYHVPKLNAWFALSSLALLAVAFWMVIDDWDRSWKDYQREFRQIEIERTRASLETPEALAALAAEAELESQLADAQADLDRRRAEIEEEEEELFQLRGKQFKDTEAAKSAKQEFNWERYLLEEGHTTEEAFIKTENGLNDAAKLQEETDAEVAAQEALVKSLYAGVDAVERDMKAAAKSIDLNRKKLAKLAPDDAPTQVANVLRDFPGLDFIGPNIKVNKVVLDKLTFELNFTKKPRIDMCQTCHLAVEREGYVEEDLEHPFRSHPKLDLFLSAKSPHPLNEVGCSICHRGSGESLHFVRSDHRPSDAAEGEAWADEYHWHKQHHWDYPMLSSKHVEASCVQCHKDSMELIAPEAPQVTKGYRLFERYGCYACHKVEWFPTKRRPGPSLKKVAEKVDSDFMSSWIADPRGFRPSTWMPQIFHLENFKPDEKVVTSNYGAGRDILGQEWNDTAIGAITSFIMSRSSDAAEPPLPVEGDPLRGRESFRLSGCLACHNMAPFPGQEAGSSDMALANRGTNEHGPNLRGVATKTTPEWLFQWIKNPTAYWAETRMPNLRLSDQEIADIVAYVFEDPDGYFTDTPEGWTEGPSPMTRDVLEEQARWYFGSKSRAELQTALETEWADDQVLSVAVGEKLVMSYGCQSCHDISGMENAMPIGAELTTWGSKTVDKLDWGHLPYIFAEERGWDHHATKEYKSYREPWISQKLAEPRSYDREKVKNPTERLKMPWFDFEEHEIDAIVTFVVGLVKDEVQRAKMVPNETQASMDLGLRAMRQKNCAACHIIEPGQITYTDEDGLRRTVEGQVFPLDSDEYIAPPLGDEFHPFLASYEDYVEEDLEEVIIELLRPEPGVGNIGDTVVVEGVENVDSIETKPAWGGDFVPLVVDYYRNAWGYDEATDEDFSKTGDPDGEGRVQDVDGEWRDYSGEEYTKVRWTFAPPFLVDEGYKVQRDWFYQFLEEPYPLRKQMRVKMPSFTWKDGEAGAIADYFAAAANKDWAVRFSRRLLVETDNDVDGAVEALAELDVPTTQRELQAMLDGYQPTIDASLSKLERFASSDGVAFEIPPPVDPSYEILHPRTPTILNGTLKRHPDFFQGVGLLTSDPQRGPNCFQCHWFNGDAPNAEGPIAWAPDLQYVRERLRPDWVREWLTNPAGIYPGTAMPANFVGEQYQELWPKPPEEQIEDVLIWLFNLDREPSR